MTREDERGEDFSQAFETLADLVNQLPAERRVELRNALGLYTHDLKHTLGLITGANGILLRLDLAGEDQAKDFREMVEIIIHAAEKIDDLVVVLVENLNNQIKTD